mmetsp:Transcript_10928/g.47291  ORF Transcript_10928/g.47291 Transcript_10928/m.47291 type:complete len:411 (-) Transcript_10928:1806-3038(-)
MHPSNLVPPPGLLAPPDLVTAPVPIVPVVSVVVAAERRAMIGSNLHVEYLPHRRVDPGLRERPVPHVLGLLLAPHELGVRVPRQSPRQRGVRKRRELLQPDQRHVLDASRPAKLVQLVVHLPGADYDAADVRGFRPLAGAGDGVGLDGVIAHVAVADDGVEPAAGAEIPQRRRTRPVVEQVLGREHDEGLDVRDVGLAPQRVKVIRRRGGVDEDEVARGIRVGFSPVPHVPVPVNAIDSSSVPAEEAPDVVVHGPRARRLDRRRRQRDGVHVRLGSIPRAGAVEDLSGGDVRVVVVPAKVVGLDDEAIACVVRLASETPSRGSRRVGCRVGCRVDQRAVLVEERKRLVVGIVHLEPHVFLRRRRLRRRLERLHPLPQPVQGDEPGSVRVVRFPDRFIDRFLSKRGEGLRG